MALNVRIPYDCCSYVNLKDIFAINDYIVYRPYVHVPITDNVCTCLYNTGYLEVRIDPIWLNIDVFDVQLIHVSISGLVKSKSKSKA